MKVLLRVPQGFAAIVLAIAWSQAGAAFVQSFASVEAGPANGCVFAPVFLPGAEVNTPESGYGVPVGPTFTYQNCFTVNSTLGHTDSGQQVNTGANTASASFSASATALNGPGTYQGTAQALASINQQKVGATASGQVSGINFGGNLLGDASGAYGVINETITPTSVSHQSGPGFIQFQYMVDGQITVNQASFNPNNNQLLGFAKAVLAIDLNNQFDAPFHTIAALSGSQAPSVTPSSGFTATLGPTGWTINYSETVLSAPLPTTFGTPQNLMYGLEVQANPQTEDGSLGTAGSMFIQTAQLTGIKMFDGNMQPVTAFLINTDAGIQLGPNGVVGTGGGPGGQVPEPATLSLLGLALAAIAWSRRQRA